MKRLLLVAAVAVVLVVGGIAGFALQTKPPRPPPPEPVETVLVSHDQQGFVEVPVDMLGLSAQVRSVKRLGIEPTIGVTASGTMFVAGGEATVWRSTDAGKSWHDVADHLSEEDQDPYLWVDPATDRVYSVPNQVMCSDVRWSDDEGDSWKPDAPLVPVANPLPEGGCGGRGHDHQSLVGGVSVAAGADGDRTLYYVYNARLAPEGAWLTRSFDGGESWESQGRRIFPSDCQLGLTGAPVVGPDGTLYVAKPGCSGLLVGVSRDGGTTWKTTALAQHGMGGGTQTQGDRTYSTNPSMAVDGAGNAYAFWAGVDGLLYLAHSRDAGTTWSTPVRATPPGINVTAFSAIVAGDAGRVAMAYVGSTSDPAGWTAREAHFAPEGTTWNLYQTWSFDALEQDPVFTTLRITNDKDPVHRGRIWQTGDAGALTRDRQLGDFLSIALRSGQPVVAYADSCASCIAPAGRASLYVAMATGPHLLHNAPDASIQGAQPPAPHGGAQGHQALAINVRSPSRPPSR